MKKPFASRAEGGKEETVGKAEREKGKRGERELAGILREHGYDCRRGQQFCGKNGDADVSGLPGIHIECKRVERLNLDNAMDQAKKDARPGEIPAVFHRKDRGEWYVTLSLADFMDIYKEADADEYIKLHSDRSQERGHKRDAACLDPYE